MPLGVLDGPTARRHRPPRTRTALHPDLDAGVAFFTDYLGLTVNGQDGDTVRLRTFDDYEHHSLVLTAREKPGLGRLALRTSSEQALHRRVEAIETAGGSGCLPPDTP